MYVKKLLLIIFLFFHSATTNSDVYKWIDENGNTVYGDKPTSADANKIEIKKKPKQDKQFQKRNKKQEKLLDVLQEERDEKTTLIIKEKEKREKQKLKCNEIIKELQELKNAGRIYEKTDDPNNPKFFTEQEKEAEEKKYNDYIKTNCKT